MTIADYVEAHPFLTALFIILHPFLTALFIILFKPIVVSVK